MAAALLLLVLLLARAEDRVRAIRPFIEKDKGHVDPDAQPSLGVRGGYSSSGYPRRTLFPVGRTFDQ